MRRAPLKVLVTGAEERQGLAVIRGLGQAGVSVVACGAQRHSLGFASRHAAESYRYRSPFEDPDGFVEDILEVVRQTRPRVVIPVVESTLALLDGVRPRIEAHATLAAPPSDVLAYALDKRKTVELAQRVGVPVPRTVWGATASELLRGAAGLRFPVAIKPRGHSMYAPTAHQLPFKVRYAAGPDQLLALLEDVGPAVSNLLVQEYAPGTGRCVATLCDYGQPLAMFAYARDREFPLTGGVSVMRRSLPLDDTLSAQVHALLRPISWRGVAMVEFRYDAQTNRYTLMEINGRFQASTALSLDAGLNLPYLVASLFAGRNSCSPARYTAGAEERWLRGDLMALLDALTPSWRAMPTPPRPYYRQDKSAALRAFLRDFRAGVRYDEFRLADWKPGVIEAAAICALLADWLAGAGRALVRSALTALWRLLRARPRPRPRPRRRAAGPRAGFGWSVKRPTLL